MSMLVNIIRGFLADTHTHRSILIVPGNTRASSQIMKKSFTLYIYRLINTIFNKGNSGGSSHVPY